jgi:acetoin utilization deacetylase AcuC-like enzyme
MRLPFRLVWHAGYNLHIGDHVFPAEKFRLIRERLIEENVADPDDFVEPQPAADDDVLLVHEMTWVDKLKHGTLTYLDILKLEIPYSPQMVRAFWLAAGGTILAARSALSDGIAFNIGGGFHHAFPGYGEGFCAINDVAIAARCLQRNGSVRRVLVVDCDVHHGNGTAAIFRDDPNVFTLSIHQYNNYPSEKPPSTVDIHLPDGTSDEEYLAKLKGAYEAALLNFKPHLVMYVAGVDPYCEDQLGGLNLTLNGMYQRDRLIFQLAREKQVPVAATTAGGYAVNVSDTVTLHCNTIRAAFEASKTRT